MLRVNAQEVETTFPSLLAAVEKQGESILICREGKPVAEIRPVRPQETRLRLHPQLSQVEFREDPMLPLEVEDWPEAES